LLSMKIHPPGQYFFLLVLGQTIGAGAAVGATGAAATGAAVGATGAAVTGAAVGAGAFGASHVFFFLLSMKIHPTGQYFLLLVLGQTIGGGKGAAVTGAAVTVCKSRRPVSSKSRTSSPPPPRRD
jgi:hypothetical protein